MWSWIHFLPLGLDWCSWMIGFSPVLRNFSSKDSLSGTQGWWLGRRLGVGMHSLVHSFKNPCMTACFVPDTMAGHGHTNIEGNRATSLHELTNCWPSRLFMCPEKHLVHSMWLINVSETNESAVKPCCSHPPLWNSRTGDKVYLAERITKSFTSLLLCVIS